MLSIGNAVCSVSTLAIATARLDLNLSRLKPSGFAIDCGMSVVVSGAGVLSGTAWSFSAAMGVILLSWLWLGSASGSLSDWVVRRTFGLGMMRASCWLATFVRRRGCRFLSHSNI